MINWVNIPRGQRPAIAALIEAACSSCKVKGRYLQRATQIGYLEALPVIEGFADHHPGMLLELRTRLGAIEDERSS